MFFQPQILDNVTVKELLTIITIKGLKKDAKLTNLYILMPRLKITGV